MVSSTPFFMIDFILSVAIFYWMIVKYQRSEMRQRRLFAATIEYSLQLSFYEYRDFLMAAQTGDQYELERRWPTWAEYRDAALRGDYTWGIA